MALPSRVRNVAYGEVKSEKSKLHYKESTEIAELRSTARRGKSTKVDGPKGKVNQLRSYFIELTL